MEVSPARTDSDAAPEDTASAENKDVERAGDDSSEDDKDDDNEDISKCNSASSNGIHYDLKDLNVLYFGVPFLSFPSVVTKGRWHHIGLDYDSKRGNIQVTTTTLYICVILSLIARDQVDKALTSFQTSGV